MLSTSGNIRLMEARIGEFGAGGRAATFKACVSIRTLRLGRPNFPQMATISECRYRVLAGPNRPFDKFLRSGGRSEELSGICVGNIGSHGIVDAGTALGAGQKWPEIVEQDGSFYWSSRSRRELEQGCPRARIASSYRI
jgi:hypothetical protein